MKKYLEIAKQLLDEGHESDGCTVPFKTFIHKWLKSSELICAAHDFGSRGLIEDVRPGWHNNVYFLLANLKNWHIIWGVTSFIWTLPYAIVRYNFGFAVPLVMFNLFQITVIGLILLINYG